MFRSRAQIAMFVLGTIVLIGVCLNIGSWWPLLVIPAALVIRLYYARKGMISR